MGLEGSEHFKWSMGDCLLHSIFSIPPFPLFRSNCRVEKNGTGRQTRIERVEIYSGTFDLVIIMFYFAGNQPHLIATFILMKLTKT